MDEKITKARYGLLLGLGVGIAIGAGTDNIAGGGVLARDAEREKRRR